MRTQWIPGFWQPLALLVSLLGASETLAIPEAGLSAAYADALPRFMQGVTHGSMRGKGGKRLAYAIAAKEGSERPIIMLLPGYSESWRKYDEVMFDFDALGFDVYALDHRGMGLSERLSTNPLVAHVEDFNDYVDDAELFLNDFVAKDPRRPTFLLGHSTGALVGAALVLKRPTAFRAAAWNAPLFALNTGNLPPLLARAVVAFNIWRGAAHAFAPGSGNYDPKTADPSQCRTTHSAVRCGHHIEQQVRDPGLVVAGPSNAWIYQAMRAAAKHQALAEGAGSLPILITQAGDDAYVLLPPQDAYCRLAKNCQKLLIKDGRHELLQESDVYRDQVLSAITQHFRKNIP